MIIAPEFRIEAPIAMSNAGYFYIVEFYSTGSEMASRHPTARSVVSELERARHEGWTPAIILRTGVWISEDELCGDAALELARMGSQDDEATRHR